MLHCRDELFLQIKKVPQVTTLSLKATHLIFPGLKESRKPCLGLLPVSAKKAEGQDEQPEGQPPALEWVIQGAPSFCSADTAAMARYKILEQSSQVLQVGIATTVAKVPRVILGKKFTGCLRLLRRGFEIRDGVK